MSDTGPADAGAADSGPVVLETTTERTGEPSTFDPSPALRWVLAALSFGAGAILGCLAIGSNVGLMAVSAYLISKSALVTNVADVALAITAVRVLNRGLHHRVHQAPRLTEYPGQTHAVATTLDPDFDNPGP